MPAGRSPAPARRRPRPALLSPRGRTDDIAAGARLRRVPVHRTLRAAAGRPGGERELTQHGTQQGMRRLDARRRQRLLRRPGDPRAGILRQFDQLLEEVDVEPPADARGVGAGERVARVRMGRRSRSLFPPVVFFPGCGEVIDAGIPVPERAERRLVRSLRRRRVHPRVSPRVEAPRGIPDGVHVRPRVYPRARGAPVGREPALRARARAPAPPPPRRG